MKLEDVEKSHDAVLWTIGCWNGKAIPVDGGDATNCITGVDFLEAFCDGRLKVGSKKVICVGGGDTSIDVVSVARRLGHISKMNDQDTPEKMYEVAGLDYLSIINKVEETLDSKIILAKNKNKIS
mgnify:CR=1 FL=1